MRAADSLEKRYELVERVAVGGMAEVFKAKAYGPHGFEKVLAIKRILPALARDPSFERRFVTEAKVAVSLSHANIVQVFDFSRFGQSLYIVMEFVDGADLAAVLSQVRDRGYGVPLEAAMHVAVELLKGLDFAHRRGVVHRDMSPSNVLLSRSGEVKIADFGIARMGGGNDNSRAIRIMGKWRYMSPEQTRGDELDERSDVFSTAVVLHELFTGQRLFPGADAEEIVHNIRSMPLPRASQVRGELPPGLDAPLLSALERDRERRTITAEQLLHEILDVCYASSLPALPTSLVRFLDQLDLSVRSDDAGTGTGSAQLIDQIIESELGVRRAAPGGGKRRTAMALGPPPMHPDDLPDEGGSDPHAAGAPPAPEPTGTFIRSVGRRDGTSEWRLETPQGTWSGLEETAESGAPVVEPESEEDEEGEEDGGDDLDDADTTTTVAPELGPPPRRAGRPVTAPPEVAPAVAPAAPRRPETTPHLGAPPRLESIIHPSPGRRWARAHLALAAAGLAAVVLVIVALSGSGGSSATTARGEAEEEGEEEGAAAAQVAKAAPAPDEPAEVVLDFAPDPMPPDSDPRPEPEEPERADGPGTDRPAPDSGRRSGRRAGSGAGSRTGSGSGPGSTSASEPKERRARFGTVDIYAEPWADIYLGKKKVGTAPQRGVRLPVGRHRLRLVNPVQQRTAWVTVTVPSSRPVQVTLPERGR